MTSNVVLKEENSNVKYRLSPPHTHTHQIRILAPPCYAQKCHTENSDAGTNKDCCNNNSDVFQADDTT